MAMMPTSQNMPPQVSDNLICYDWSGQATCMLVLILITVIAT